MREQWVIVYQSLAGERIYGPYETAALASGAAMTAFGDAGYWRVQKLEEL